MSWPFSEPYRARYLVPDLVPNLPRFKAIFIGESPHRDEVAPEIESERTPFRGMAGRHWWKALYEVSGEPQTWKVVPPREELLRVCTKLQIAIINAVQFPLDPNIILHAGEGSTPSVNLGFEKSKGEWSYLRVYRGGGSPNPVESALENLTNRLRPVVSKADRIVALGNDSKWFVTKVLTQVGKEDNAFTLIPHPSAWWRNPAFRQRALDILNEIK